MYLRARLDTLGQQAYTCSTIDRMHRLFARFDLEVPDSLLLEVPDGDAPEFQLHRGDFAIVAKLRPGSSWGSKKKAALHRTRGVEVLARHGRHFSESPRLCPQRLPAPLRTRTVSVGANLVAR